jgi:D-2-hydroxyacid dehydrogenase (NADP+)
MSQMSHVYIGFAHVAYQFEQEFATRSSSARTFEVRSLDELRARVADADVLVVSGLWRNELVEAASRLRFIQSISAGTDQFDKAMLASRGIRLASAQGANERAVAEHAMALILALVRQLPQARDNQAKSSWRGMIADRTRREDELGGKLLLIVGLGRIGSRLARLAKVFDMRVVGIRRSPGVDDGTADSILWIDHLGEALGQADVIALTCPLTPETRGLIGAEALARCKPGTLLVNVARGPVVDEPALVEALQAGRLAGRVRGSDGLMPCWRAIRSWYRASGEASTWSIWRSPGARSASWRYCRIFACMTCGTPSRRLALEPAWGFR